MSSPSRLLNTEFLAGPLAVRLDRQRLVEPFPLHWHEFYEWTIVLDGLGWHKVNGESHSLAPGDTFLMTPADFHAIGPAAGSQLALANLIFGRSVLGDALGHLLFDGAYARQIRCVSDGLAALHACLARIERERAQRLAGCELVVQGAVTELLIVWHRLRPRAAGGGGRADPFGVPAGVRKSLMYIQHHFRQPITLEDAADQAHLSTNYFSELFHKSVGCTFQQYLQRLRLEFAHALLHSSELPVTEIAYSAGFNTLTHFSRVFRQAYGQAPSGVSRRRSSTMGS
ncbi:AraC family transcriptional regulator [Duganella sp. PWIR1]